MPSADFGQIHSRIPVERFAFDFTGRWPAMLRPLGITPATSSVEVGDGLLDVRFGRWRLRTTTGNVASADVGGPYSPWKVLGARLSWADQGVTFGTNPRAGVCVRLHRPVPAIDPFGVVLHPALTLTVAEPEALARALWPGFTSASAPADEVG